MFHESSSTFNQTSTPFPILTTVAMDLKPFLCNLTFFFHFSSSLQLFHLPHCIITNVPGWFPRKSPNLACNTMASYGQWISIVVLIGTFKLSSCFYIPPIILMPISHATIPENMPIGGLYFCLPDNAFSTCFLSQTRAPLLKVLYTTLIFPSALKDEVYMEIEDYFSTCFSLYRNYCMPHRVTLLWDGQAYNYDKYINKTLQNCMQFQHEFFF